MTLVDEMEVLKAIDGLKAQSSNSEGLRRVYRKVLESGPACWVSKPARRATRAGRQGRGAGRATPRLQHPSSTPSSRIPCICSMNSTRRAAIETTIPAVRSCEILALLIQQRDPHRQDRARQPALS